MRRPDIGPDIGGVAQVGERLLCKQEVIGSNPFTSTIRCSFDGATGPGRANLNTH